MNKLELEGTGKLSKLTSIYQFLPKTDLRQEMMSIDYFSMPLADTVITSIGKFVWHDLHNEYRLGYHSSIKTKFYQYPIEHSDYRHVLVPDSLKKYLRFDHLISNNKKIKIQTETIIKDENELFVIAFKIGNWINNNIKYIKTGVNKVEPAISTLSVKYGDCDEIAILYIAMLRSVGIPSKYVSGIALGNLDFRSHAWIEIYFKNVGWVPFDATFNQYAYLDQSHIKLVHGISKPTFLTNYHDFYSHFGDINIESGFPKISAIISDSISNNITPFDLEVVSYKNIIGEESYFPIIIKTKNRSPHFVSNQIFIRDIENIEIIGDKKYCLWYAPYEEKRIKCMLKLVNVENLELKYTTTFGVYDQFGSYKEIDVSFVRYGKRITKDKAYVILDTL